MLESLNRVNKLEKEIYGEKEKTDSKRDIKLEETYKQKVQQPQKIEEIKKEDKEQQQERE